MTDKDVLIRLGETIAARKAAEAGSSYVASLLAKGEDAILRKVLEETADLWFHTLVLLAWHGAGPEDVLAELQRREGQSGIAEKASRK
jgi:phosphoribosyl-ATP pyrophosphohydrolase